MSKVDRSKHNASVEEITEKITNDFLESLKVDTSNPKNKTAMDNAANLLIMQGKMHDAGQPYLK